MFQGLFEFAPDAVFVTGDDGRIRHANRAAEATFGYGRGELLGQEVEVLVPERLREPHRLLRRGYADSPRTRPMGEGRELYGRRKAGEEFPVDVTLAPLETPDGPLVLSTIRDISHRKANEDIIRAQARQQAAVAALGRVRLGSADFPAFLGEAVSALCDTLRAEVSDVLELLPGGELLLRAGLGWAEGEVGTAVFDGGEGSQAGYCLRAGTPVIVPDLRTEGRFAPSPPLLGLGAVSGLSVCVPGDGGRPYGKLGVWSTRPRRFTVEDVNFVQAVGHLVATVRRRLEAEAALRRQSRVTQSILNSMGEGVVVADQDGKFLLFNRAAERMLGVGLLDTGPSGWSRSLLHPRPRHRGARPAGEAAAGAGHPGGADRRGGTPHPQPHPAGPAAHQRHGPAPAGRGRCGPGRGGGLPRRDRPQECGGRPA